MAMCVSVCGGVFIPRHRVLGALTLGPVHRKLTLATVAQRDGLNRRKTQSSPCPESFGSDLLFMRGGILFRGTVALITRRTCAGTCARVEARVSVSS